MHLDHDKFFDLLVENTGMTPEKAEKQLAELLAEMKSAFDEDDAYEIEGFGIFSKLGNAVHFIPSEGLATEINYKYAGMEPIEMPGSVKSESEPEENPIRGMMGDEDVYEDPFEDIFNEKEELENDGIEGEDAELSTADEELEAPNELEDALSVFIGADDEAEGEDIDADEIETQAEESPEIEDPFEEVINEAADDASIELENEAAEEEKESEPDKVKKPGPEQWGINAHKQEGQENAFTGLVGDSKADDDEAELPEEKLAEETTTEDEEDFIPIVTNVSSGSGKAKKDSSKDESPKAKAEVAPKALRDRRESSPAILYVILIILVIGIAGYASVYFGLINIDGITDSNNQTAQTTMPSQPEQSAISATPTGTADETTDKAQESVQKPKVEQPVQEQVAAVTTTTQQSATSKPSFGLKGSINEAANTGYTIVLYHLSRESGADRARKELDSKGMRTIVKEIPSSKYGVLYRVSVGQFRTMADAAQAVEDNKGLFSENYSITKIN